MSLDGILTRPFTDFPMSLTVIMSNRVCNHKDFTTMLITLNVPFTKMKFLTDLNIHSVSELHAIKNESLGTNETL